MKYSIGLDIGVASVGWAVINEDLKRIEDLGVRIFEAAEHPKTGASLSTARRVARGARRRLNRRRGRLNSVKNIFIEQGWLTAGKIHDILMVPHNPYFIRNESLVRKLSAEELFISLYHIAKHRGFKSNRKKVEEADKNETGKMIASVKENHQLLSKYRTVAEAVLNDAKFEKHKRNKGGTYLHTFSREDFEKELHEILTAQQNYGFPLEEGLISRITSTIIDQKAFASADEILKKVGTCTFEKNEKRAAKATFAFERFSFLQKLVHLKLYNSQSGEYPLNPAQVNRVFTELALEKSDVKYKQIRTLLNLPKEDSFANMPNKKKKRRNDNKENDPEEQSFGKLKAYNEIRKAINDENLWNQIHNDTSILNKIGTILTVYKTDQEIKEELKEKTNLPDNAIANLLSLSFSGFGHLSLNALEKITPFLFEGITYDKACQKAGYEFRGGGGDKQKKLPALQNDFNHEITNPVVRRALSQSIKVINAIIDKYGSPYMVKIECARDLTKSHEDRRKIEKEQNENKLRNEKIIEKLKELGDADPKGEVITKYRLYEEQQGKCMYSLETIDEHRFLEKGYTEIDHAIPTSRGGQLGYLNKVLVLTAENREKTNRTPYEFFGNVERKWHLFVAFVKSLNVHPKKKQNLLIEKYKNTDWNIRALNDTRYIARFLKNYLEDNLLFIYGEPTKRVIVANGQTTAYMRQRWGLQKNRDENVLHHATDAAVVGIMSDALLQKVARYSKFGEVKRYLQSRKGIDGLIDPETGEIYDQKFVDEAKQIALSKEKIHFPLPWDRFDDEVRIRIKEVNKEEMINNLRDFPTYRGDVSNVRPIFVSRMPKRRATGEAHEATLRSPKLLDKNISQSRVPINKIKLSDLEHMAGKDSDQQLYNTLKARLEEYNDDPKKAFTEPVFKRDKEGHDVHRVRSVKLINTQKSGFLINQGKAVVDNGDIVRVDIFSKAIKGKKRFFSVPVYVHQIKKLPLPVKIFPGSSQFKEVDETFTFCFSIFPNDLLKIADNEEEVFGYFVSYNINGGQYRLIQHAASNKEILKNKNIGTAKIVEKYQVDMLGNIFQVKSETRK